MKRSELVLTIAWVVVVGLSLGGTAVWAEGAQQSRVPLAGVEIADLFPGRSAPADVRIWAVKAAAGAAASSGKPRLAGNASTFSTIQGSVFLPNHDAFIVGDAPPWGLFCEAGGNRFASAQAKLPHGAGLTALRIWTRDDTADSALAVSVWEVCRSEAKPDASDVTFLGSVLSTPGISSDEVTFDPAAMIDSVNCFYPVLAVFGTGAVTCGPDLVLYKVRLTWDRPSEHVFADGFEPANPTTWTGGMP